jgi:hypothetical protein
MRITPGNLARDIAAGLLLGLAFSGGAEQPDVLLTYPPPAGVSVSPHYRVQVEQAGKRQESPVYFSKAQWRSNVHPDTSWTSFSFAGKVTVRVVVPGAKSSRVRLLPTSVGIVPKVDGDTAAFVLEKPCQLALEFDGNRQHPLLIFADPVETDVPKPGAPNVVYFGPGVHDLPSDFQVRSGQTIYLSGGAWVRGRLLGRDAAGVRICGRGVLDGSQLPGKVPDVREPEHFVMLRGRSDDVKVEGITLVGSPHFNLTLNGDRCVVRNVKMISWWFSTDGVGLGAHGLVEDSFFKVNDDAVKLYRSDMTVRRCTFWQMENGAPFQLSWNMSGQNRGFRVSDCDILHCEHRWKNDNCAIFCSIHGGSGHMSDYLFENIRIENATWRLISLLIKPNEFARGVREPGTISNVTFRHITADGPFNLPNRVRGWGANSRVEKVNFEDVRVGGLRWTSATDANLEVDLETTRNIRVQ